MVVRTKTAADDDYSLYSIWQLKLAGYLDGSAVVEHKKERLLPQWTNLGRRWLVLLILVISIPLVFNVSDADDDAVESGFSLRPSAPLSWLFRGRAMNESDYGVHSFPFLFSFHFRRFPLSLDGFHWTVPVQQHYRHKRPRTIHSFMHTHSLDSSSFIPTCLCDHKSTLFSTPTNYCIALNSAGEWEVVPLYSPLNPREISKWVMMLMIKSRAIQPGNFSFIGHSLGNRLKTLTRYIFYSSVWQQRRPDPMKWASDDDKTLGRTVRKFAQNGFAADRVSYTKSTGSSNGNSDGISCGSYAYLCSQTL